ncbi:hypothetical protein [Actinoplanes friuliensis]|uniref:DUF4333 domain-containing protein n=1 Tax=Actinoplanes friuliensis DSM 7358 TaxID=1246995 RepID=U5VWG1_9ACTN|nr:hypothetical protein [Actinoplanes friuliensis]AGZ40001.1 hypothetical protein AFR_08560 [Actinoplanes friuliensis DSM 7358]
MSTEYPQFATGYAQYPPAQDQYAAPVSAPPVTDQGEAFPPVAYPQEGAADYPEPVAYPQLTVPAGYPGEVPEASGLPQAGAYPPPSAYPTAPPWAAASPEPEPAPSYPGQAVTGHGGLLVPFPDEMQHASRAQPPAVWPVAIFTLFFGILGAFSASRRAGAARRGRNSTAPYWITYLVTLAAAGFVWFVMSAVVILPLVDSIQESSRLSAVQDAVVNDGQLKGANIDVTSAQCRAISDRNAAGMREYLCRLTLGDGHTGSLMLTADTDGHWTSPPGA